MKWKMWVFRIIIPAILCVAAIMVFRKQYRAFTYEANREYYELRDIRARLSELDGQRAALQDQLDKLEEEHSNKESPYFTLSPIFTSPDEELFPKIVNILDERYWAGTMCLSEKMIPGRGDCISEDTFYELLDDGWDYCLYWDGEGSLEDFLKNMQYLLRKEDIDFPTTIVFRSGSYSEDYDELLEEYDIELLVHHGEEDLDVPTLEWDEEEMIKFASCDWNNSNMELILNAAEENGGLFGITIYYNFIKSTDNLDDVTYFLEYIEKISDENERCFVGTISAAMDLKENEKTESLVSQEEEQAYQEERGRLEEEIRKIDEEKKGMFE